MPGMGGRMSTVIKAKINKLLDRAEDPSETLEYSYQKQMELLQNVKKGIADVEVANVRQVLTTPGRFVWIGDGSNFPGQLSTLWGQLNQVPL